ncbi:nuclear RNA export factor 1-like [Phymastichus coffea]|uniref:nuclear RNA export factor 1-like n=1 Tax=Phymastichus coffea TaxID=108790 RepID=UPI00273B345C|nr:nuclear RNA export factor 1-like [Phymastichus coffea]
MATEYPSEKIKYINPVRISHTYPAFASDEEVEAANQINVWHKFILFDVRKEQKEMVLDRFIEICSPVFFIPVKYTQESETKATFLSFCRSQTIQKLALQKLQFKLKNGKTIYYDIVLSFLSFNDMQLNPQAIISEAIKSRFIKDIAIKNFCKTFNLENFSNDPLFTSIYCPIHIPIMFDAILRFSKSVACGNNTRDKLPVKDLILRNNNLDTLLFSEKIFSYHLTKLDVRDNKLRDINLLRPFAEYKIIELWLDGNPLCDEYESVKDYVTAVKSIFPSVQILDGQSIGMEQRYMPSFHKHFIGDRNKISLIKQFVQHFFTCYDQDDRIVLNGLYDATAIFSMTVGQITDNSHKELIKSFATNRNLLKFVDYAKCTEFLLYGPEKIISILRQEPPTLHKLSLLDIDVLHHTSNHFSLSVQGPFIYRKTKASPLWFHRTLIVIAKQDNEYCIVNDQYHIDNCPTSFTDFRNLYINSGNVVPVYKPLSFSNGEKFQLQKCLQELTTMNPEYSDKCLKEANYDLHRAIRNFMTNYTNNKIPLEAFRW